MDLRKHNNFLNFQILIVLPDVIWHAHGWTEAQEEQVITLLRWILAP